MSVMPGEFLGRSVLGFTDNHVAEVFYTTVAALFLVMAIKTSQERQFTFRSFASGLPVKPFVYSLLAGLFLGLYLLTWIGALLFVFIVALFFVAQFLLDHWRGRSTAYLGVSGTLVFLVAFLMYLPVFVVNIDAASSLMPLVAVGWRRSFPWSCGRYRP